MLVEPFLKYCQNHIFLFLSLAIEMIGNHKQGNWIPILVIHIIDSFLIRNVRSVQSGAASQLDFNLKYISDLIDILASVIELYG